MIIKELIKQCENELKKYENNEYLKGFYTGAICMLEDLNEEAISEIYNEIQSQYKGKSIMKSIKIESVKQFINKMMNEGANPSFITTQLNLFTNGYRGSDLHDNCQILIDGLI